MPRLRTATFRLFFSLPLLIASLFAFSASASAQILCQFNSTTPPIHAEGFAERLGDITTSCTGGTPGSSVSLTVFVTLNTTITNRLNSDQQPLGINVTGVSNAVRVTASATTLNISPLNYIVPNPSSTPVAITLSGIRAAAATLPPGTAVTASVLGVGATFLPNAPLIVSATSSPTLLASVINNGVPCNGSPLPATLDFLTFAAGTSSSTIRVTEAGAAAFTPMDAGADNGLRFVVNISGYGPGARVFVPDAITGNSGTLPTSSGAFSSTISPGAYTPSAQLLLIRVDGATPGGVGGTLAMAKPVVPTTFSSMTEVALSNGSASLVYEVVDSSLALAESAQIPVFVVVNATICPSTLAPQLSVSVGPVSSVAVATASTADAIPRFVASTPGLDCQMLFDCSAGYYPKLVVDQTPLVLAGSSRGAPQSLLVRVSNLGSGILNFTTSIAYQSGTSWLSVSPSSGANNVSMQVIADPTGLDEGVYRATVTVNAGLYGVASVPVTFNVGPLGVVVQNVGNAASFQYGTVAPGSYAVLYGLNLAGTNVGVTFNGLPATLIYTSTTQINLIVPAALGSQQAASVVVTVDGLVSNSFKANLILNSPGIFTPGIVNFADGTVNDASHPAMRGDFVIVFLTGLTIPLTGQVTVNIGGQTNLIPAFAGAQTTLPALDQVNIVVPVSLPAANGPVPLQVCIPGSTGQQVCSNAVNLFVR